MTHRAVWKIVDSNTQTFDMYGTHQGGKEMKMMEIARALAMRPKLLLLDEAMAGMPLKEIDALVELLKAIKQTEQIAVVAMVEHIMRAVVNFADRVVVLYQGKKLLEGAPTEVLNDPRVVDVYLGRETEG